MSELLNSVIDVDQIVRDGFRCEAVDALTRVADVREFYELPDEIEDDEIEAAMKSAAKDFSYPYGTIVLVIKERVEWGLGKALSGAIHAALDVYAEDELSEEVLGDLALIDELEADTVHLGGVHREDERDADAVVYEAIMLPRKKGGYGAADRTDRGVSLGFVHVVHDRRDVLDDLDAAA